MGSSRLTAIGKDGEQKRDALLQSLLSGIQKRDAFVVTRAIDAGVSPNAVDKNGEPILGIAARFGFLAGMRAILERGAHPDETNPKGQTALTLSVMACLPDDAGVEAADLLLSFGANPNHRCDKGMTPMMWGAAEEQDRVVERLIKSGGVLTDDDIKALGSEAEWHIDADRLDRIVSLMQTQMMLSHEPIEHE